MGLQLSCAVGTWDSVDGDRPDIGITPVGSEFLHHLPEMSTAELENLESLSVWTHGRIA